VQRKPRLHARPRAPAAAGGRQRADHTQLQGGGSPWSFALGYRPWSCVPTRASTVVVNSRSFGHGTLEDLIDHGVYYDDRCDLASSVSGEISVTAATARRLHLHDTVIGRVSDGPGDGAIELGPGARSALRRAARAVEVRVALDARGQLPNQHWSYTATLRVSRAGGA